MAAETIPTAQELFVHGKYNTVLITVESTSSRSSTEACPAPPKPVMIVTPTEGGEYPVLVFLHGYLLYNSFYSQLFGHVASHGFVVVAPQLYLISGPDATAEIHCASSVVDWLPNGLPRLLPPHVTTDLGKLAIAGHSRGGKVAFALATGSYAETSLKFSAVIGVDPVDGTGKGSQTPPPILKYVPQALLVGTPVLVLGSGLGGLKRSPLFPPCAPKGVSHQEFFDECGPPAYHLVAKDYGHTDMLDNETPGLRGQATYCLCKSGEARRPMRAFVAGAMVAFLQAHLRGDHKGLRDLQDHPEACPVELSTITFLE